MKLKGVLVLVALAGATAALWPSTAGAASGGGIVVGRQAGLLLVASPSGLVRAVRGNAALGSRVVLGSQMRVVGHVRTATIRGVVVRQTGGMLFLSSASHLLAIHVGAGRRPAVVSQTPSPAPGTVVTTQVGVSSSGLDEQSEQDDGQMNASAMSVQATVSAVAAGTVTLSVQGQTLTVPLPAGLTLPASLVGQTVTIQVSLNGGNGNSQGDDDQGDSGGGGGGDSSGGGGGD